MGIRLKYYREMRGLKQEELAATLGVSRSTISSYERGNSAPNLETLKLLSETLHVSIDELLENDQQPWAMKSMSNPLQQFVKKYMSLSENRSKIVWDLVDELSNGGTDVQKHENCIPEYVCLEDIGNLEADFGTDFHYIPVKEYIPNRVIFGVRIQEDNMEPKILKGSTVYVDRAPLKQGDVGIFEVNGKIICRQYQRDLDGTVHLTSLKRKSAEDDLIFHQEEEWNIKFYGRVILSKEEK